MKIGVVNAMPSMAEMLRELIARQQGCEVIWTAHAGSEAVALCEKTTPDLILMDLNMRGITGVEATRRIMARTPCAILIVTGDPKGQASAILEAMGCGALDALDMPSPGSDAQLARTTALLTKIDNIRKRLGSDHDTLRAARLIFAPTQTPREERLIAIGASAGGPAALTKLLTALPSNFPAPIVIVQHVNAEFAMGLASWLDQESTLPVRVAQPGDRPTGGRVLVAATNDHLIVTTGGRLDYVSEPSEYVYRPSVDVFFHSVREFWPHKAVGVLLTGMGRDGAVGLKALRDAGCHTIAQDELSSAVYGMPKAALMLDAAVDILPIGEIAARLVTLVSKEREIS
jgi:two-component system response regulator WspF